MFDAAVTIFNRREGLWYPTVMTGVQVQTDLGGLPDKYGGRREDTVLALVPYVLRDGAAEAAGKLYLPPKLWRRTDQPERYITFSTGEHFDLLLLGTWEGSEPVEDGAWPGGFYDYLNRSGDRAFALTSCRRFASLPHFELTGR